LTVIARPTLGEVEGEGRGNLPAFRCRCRQGNSRRKQGRLPRRRLRLLLAM